MRTDEFATSAANKYEYNLHMYFHSNKQKSFTENNLKAKISRKFALLSKQHLNKRYA